MFFPGQKFRPSAARENEIDRVLRDYRAGSGLYSAGQSREMPIGHILAKNSTGSDLGFGRGAIYNLGGFTNTEGATRRDYDCRKGLVTLVPMVDVTSNPVSEIGGLAMTLEPIANNKIGRVAIAGLAILADDTLSPALDQRYIYPSPTGIKIGYSGFARWLIEDPASEDLRIVDLSDRKLQCFYTLTANMTAGSANATLSPGSTTYTTTVHDVHAIAAFQQSGDAGFCEWRGTKWVVTIPFCG